MRKILLDSHVLIWLLYEPERLGTMSRQMIEQSETVYVSAVSLWELTVKHLNGKLAYMPAELVEGINALGVTQLDLKASHNLRLGEVSLAHKDPFDKMLLAQALDEDCDFMTADTAILAANLAVKLHNIFE